MNASLADRVLHQPARAVQQLVEPIHAMTDETIDPSQSTINFSKQSSITAERPTIEGYELEEKLGEGAFGSAFRAIQQSTGQAVAVKILTKVNSRFREEVERLSTVSDHPNIVTLVDADLDHDPPYFVTPLLAGSLVDETPSDLSKVDVEQVSAWFRELAVALSYIHGRGILHCDLKPANVLLGNQRHARLTDFGQAALHQENQARLGSFWYMPLAQTESTSPHVSWDLYGLGATIYTLLTGQPPRSNEAAVESLRSQSSVSAQIEDYQNSLRVNKLIPVRELNPKVDKELGMIVEHCLQTSDGYSSAAELVQDLDRRKAGQPLAAHPFSYSYLIERFVARHKVSVAVGLLAATILLLGLGSASYEVYRARQARHALIQKQFERGQSLLADGQSIGLLWILRAYSADPNEAFRQALLEGLSKQPQVAAPDLYAIRTMTAPAPSGHWALVRDPKNKDIKYRVDLRTGETELASSELFATHIDQKDRVRYRLDGAELDPYVGGGGPAAWRIRSSESILPGHNDFFLALLVTPDKVLRVERHNRGLRILDDSDQVLKVVEVVSSVPTQPTLSLQGELAHSWETGGIVWYQADGKKLEDKEFYGDLFAFSPGGKYLAASDGDTKVRVWNREGEKVADFPISGTGFELNFSRSQELLVCSTRSGLVYRFDLLEKKQAGPPIQLQKPARWLYVQENDQVVTMSNSVTVWKSPEPVDGSLKTPQELEKEVARRTGWIFDRERATLRQLDQQEYLSYLEKGSLP